MTPERALEILQKGSKWANYSKHCTSEEDAYVKYVWEHMPGYTCWYDALVRIAKGQVDKNNIVTYNNSIRGIITDTDGLKYGIRLENGNFVWAERSQIS